MIMTMISIVILAIIFCGVCKLISVLAGILFLIIATTILLKLVKGL